MSLMRGVVLVIMVTASYVYSFHNIDANVIKKYLPANPIVIDAGAYKGVETIEFTKVWPSATIHAFEPAPNVFEELKRNVSSYKNIKIYPLALSDKIGYMSFYISCSDERNDPGCDQSSSLLEPKLHYRHFTNIAFKEPVQVATITLDEWAQKEGIDHVDFLWFDLQGVEYDVLKASPNILRTVRVIFTEVNYVELYKGNCLYGQYKQWLLDQGFIEVYHKRATDTFGDALFVRKELV